MKKIFETFNDFYKSQVKETVELPNETTKNNFDKELFIFIERLLIKNKELYKSDLYNADKTNLDFGSTFSSDYSFFLHTFNFNKDDKKHKNMDLSFYSNVLGKEVSLIAIDIYQPADLVKGNGKIETYKAFIDSFELTIDDTYELFDYTKEFINKHQSKDAKKGKLIDLLSKQFKPDLLDDSKYDW
jgi:hypothetical protein